MARLVVQAGQNIGQEYVLQDSTVIGRSSSNPICVDDHLASREHCKVVKEEDSYYIVDLESRNGTRVNEEKIKKQKLNIDDIIRIGQVKLRFATDERVKPETSVEPIQTGITPSKKRSLVRQTRETTSNKTLFFVLLFAFFVLLVFLSKSVGYSIAKRALEDTKPAIPTGPE